MATYHAPFQRKGPGLLLQDLLQKPERLASEVSAIIAVAPDLLLLTNFDYDYDSAALIALSDQLASKGVHLPHHFALQPNTGVPTGQDIDGDGRSNGPRDAQGYGWFQGQGGMAVLSRWPLDGQAAVDFSALLWRDLPDSQIASDDPAYDLQRLSSAGHWVVPVQASQPFAVLAYHATPPVFDGPEDRNGRRNADETALWLHYLANRLDIPATTLPVIVMGNANLDPTHGEGLRPTIAALTSHPRLQDVQPSSDTGTATVDWPEPTPGRLRVSYVLPDIAFQVLDSGVHWTDGEPLHKLVWVDLKLQP